MPIKVFYTAHVCRETCLVGIESLHHRLLGSLRHGSFGEITGRPSLARLHDRLIHVWYLVEYAWIGPFDAPIYICHKWTSSTFIEVALGLETLVDRLIRSFIARGKATMDSVVQLLLALLGLKTPKTGI